MLPKAKLITKFRRKQNASIGSDIGLRRLYLNHDGAYIGVFQPIERSTTFDRYDKYQAHLEHKARQSMMDEPYHDNDWLLYKEKLIDVGFPGANWEPPLANECFIRTITDQRYLTRYPEKAKQLVNAITTKLQEDGRDPVLTEKLPIVPRQYPHGFTQSHVDRLEAVLSKPPQLDSTSMKKEFENDIAFIIDFITSKNPERESTAERIYQDLKDTYSFSMVDEAKYEYRTHGRIIHNSFGVTPKPSIFKTLLRLLHSSDQLSISEGVLLHTLKYPQNLPPGRANPLVKQAQPWLESNRDAFADEIAVMVDNFETLAEKFDIYNPSASILRELTIDESTSLVDYTA